MKKFFLHYPAYRTVLDVLAAGDPPYQVVGFGRDSSLPFHSSTLSLLNPAVILLCEFTEAGAVREHLQVLL